MATLTIHQAADTTGWSPRMLRYLERVGLVVPPRSGGGYRVYGAAELQRLRSLRELLAQYDLGLSNVAFAKRLRDNPRLADAVSTWLEAWLWIFSKPARPQPIGNQDWLSFEQEKGRKLLASATHAA